LEDFNDDDARSRVYIDRRIKNMIAVLTDYRGQGRGRDASRLST
jgi:hypothetical protein